MTEIHRPYNNDAPPPGQEKENAAAELPRTFRMGNLGVRLMLGIRALARR
jgi:hypothetical protein